MSRPLTREDVRDFLTGFAAAIELDQIRVDALPSEKFHPEYDEGMWRQWRRSHLVYIDQLLPTVDAIPPAILQELTQLALTCRPDIVRGAPQSFCRSDRWQLWGGGAWNGDAVLW